MVGSDVSFLMLHLTRHQISSTTVKPLLSSKLWRPSPWHRMSERNRFNLTSRNAPMISIWSILAHGKDGRYLMLVVGPFANLSDDFVVLCDFLGRARALKAIHSWNISPKHALAMNRNIFSLNFGHLASLVWANLILGRFRDAVLPDFSRFFLVHSDDYLNAFFSDPRYGRYFGRYFPGAYYLRMRHCLLSS